MSYKILKLQGKELPKRLQQLYDPPKSLFVIGSNEAELEELLSKPCLAVVGSRKASPYGQAVTKQLVRELAEAGVVIISGLAYGIDSIAHQAALDVQGLTIAVMPAGLGSIYPVGHKELAKEIIENGGALVSEYDIDQPPMKHQFIARNRLIAALADGVLITEAAAKSGTLHTADFALDQGNTVMAVPGSINSPTSEGTNNLIKAGAIPVTTAEDVLTALDIHIPVSK